MLIHSDDLITSRIVFKVQISSFYSNSKQGIILNVQRYIERQHVHPHSPWFSDLANTLKSQQAGVFHLRVSILLASI